MHNFLSIILINYLGGFQFRQQVNEESKEKALELMQKAVKKFGRTELKKAIEEDTTEYDRSPYKQDVLYILSLVDID